jgi:ribonuclease VapC
VIAFDASAALAFLFGEPGAERVADLLGDSCMSTVNLAEVLGRFVRDGHDPRQVLQRIAESPIELVPFLSEDAALAAALIPATRPLGLGLGDRACLALGLARRIPVCTADRTWLAARLDIEIQVIR